MDTIKRKAEDSGETALDMEVKRVKVDQAAQPAVPPPHKRIIIPPISHAVASQGIFTCDGSGILLNSIPFVPTSHFFPAAVEDEIVSPRQPIKWWMAQCTYRGLDTSGRMRTLQERVRSAQNVGMTDEIRALEEKLKADFWARNMETHESRWRSFSDIQKAEEDCERFLRERYLGREPASDAFSWERRYMDLGTDLPWLLLDHDSHSSLSPAETTNLARKLGLVCETNRSHIVVGPNTQAVAVMMQDICEQARRDGAQRYMARKSAKAHRRVVAAEKRARAKTRTLAVLNGWSKPEEEWDVSGTWEIRCKDFEKDYRYATGDTRRKKCRLVIVSEPVSEGSRMWASFAFLHWNGVFRFENDDSRETPADEGGLSNSPPNPRPSIHNRTWYYQWRGFRWLSYQSEPGWEDSQRGEIAFDVSSSTLHGTLETSYDTERTTVHFTGRKISRSTPHADPFSDGGDTDITAQDLAQEWMVWDRNDRELD
ncbi:hypothetical protein HWV62_7427 [Athelia sp. TMB]|nr:hypothetical protein HWV62_7427 [Athelia sp. TMB]